MSAPSWVLAARERLSAFVSEPSSPRPLGVFRIGVSLVLLAQAWTLADSLGVLFGDRGLIPWSVSGRLDSGWLPRLGLLAPLLQKLLGLSENGTLHALTSLYVLGLVGLLLGWRTRLCALVAFLGHATLLNTGTLFAYGIDIFGHIALFYCLVLPVGAAYALDSRAGRSSPASSAEATLGLRVLQVHLCLVYLSAGVEKALGPTWQQGTALWDSLMHPEYTRLDFAWMAFQPWVSWFGSWATLVVEVGYAVFVWPRRTRMLWVVLTVGLHAGIAFAMGLWLFSAIMAVLTVSAFGCEALRQPVEQGGSVGGAWAGWWLPRLTR